MPGALLDVNGNALIGVTGSSANIVPNSGLYVESNNFNTKGNAMVAFNQTGSGPIFTASASGNTRLILDNNGAIAIGSSIPSNPYNGKLNFYDLNAVTDSWGNAAIITTDALAIDKGGQITMGGKFASSGNPVYQYFAGIAGRKENSTDGNAAGYLALSTTAASGGHGLERLRITSTGLTGINTQTPLALFDARGNAVGGINSIDGTIPVASISGKTSFAGLVVDNSGAGDIFTASSSGLPRFVITQAGNVGYWHNVPRETARKLGRFDVPIGHG
jgi:hypothetical protein